METVNPVKIETPRRGLNPGLLLLVSVMVFFGACNQDPIFYSISQEVELRDPQIRGTPTNMVVFGDSLYVANRTTLYRYGTPQGSNEAAWGPVAQPGGYIKGVSALAITKAGLFILTDDGLKQFKADGTGWDPVPVTYDGEAGSYANLQSIYGDPAGDHLFAAGWNRTTSENSRDYAILYLDGTALKALKTGIHRPNGLAYDTTNAKYFASTRGSGIFAISNPPTDPGNPVNGSGDNISSIITLDDGAIVAVRRDGEVISLNSAGTFVNKHDLTDRSTSTALAKWRQPGPPGGPFQLLLAGIQGSSSSLTSYVNGYREIPLENGTLPATVTSDTPGNSSTPSVANPERYASSLGKLHVNHLFQVPYEIDEKMPVFASTQKDGLYSYRDHGDGDEYWNAE
jgi:hypothetical protein